MVNIVEVLGLGRRGFGMSRGCNVVVYGWVRSRMDETMLRESGYHGVKGLMPMLDATYDFKAQRWSGSRVTLGPCGGVAGLTALGVAHPSLPILECLCRQPTFRPSFFFTDASLTCRVINTALIAQL